MDYLVKLIKKPVDEKKMRAITKRFSSLDEETMKKVNLKLRETFDKYYQCLREFLESGLKSARVEIPGIKPLPLAQNLRERIKMFNLDENLMVSVRRKSLPDKAKLILAS